MASDPSTGAGDQPAAADNAAPEPRAPARAGARWIVVGVVVGVLVGALAWGIGMVAWFRDPLPMLTEAALDAAEARWRANQPAGYRLELRISGVRAGDVQVEVYGGKVIAMTRDGVVPEQRRTWEYWTVEHQFDTIRQDLEAAADPVKGFGAPPGSQAVLRAEFDPALGYPKRYQRVVLGASLDAGWETIRFESADP